MASEAHSVKRRGKYPSLVTDTEMNCSFSIYLSNRIRQRKKDDFNSSIPATITKFSDANPARKCWEVSMKGFWEFE